MSNKIIQLTCLTLLLSVSGFSQSVVSINLVTHDGAPVQNALVNIAGHEYTSDENDHVLATQVPNDVREVTLPFDQSLLPAYPNPFNPSVMIPYQLRDAEQVAIDIYDIQGHLVKRLIQGYQQPGTHTVLWDGLNGNGSISPAGIYIVRFRAGESLESSKVVKLDGAGVSSAGFSVRSLKRGSFLSKAAGEYNNFELVNLGTTAPQVKDTTYTDIWVEGDTVHVEFIMQRQGEAPSLGVLADLQWNEDEPPDGVLANIIVSDDFTPTDQLIIEVINANPSLLQLTMTESDELTLEYLQPNGFGTAEIDIVVTDLDGNSATQSFTITVNEMRDVTGHLVEIENHASVPGLVKVNDTTTETDSAGYFEFQFTPSNIDSIRFQAFEDGEPISYIRMIPAVEDILDSAIQIVPYLHDSTGVSDMVFVGFASEANLGPSGLLKKIDFDNAQDYTYWISAYNPSNGDTFSVEEQEILSDSLQSNVLASIPPENRPGIYLGTSQDEIPNHEQGILLILPRRGSNAGMGVFDFDNNGSIDGAVIFLPDAYNQQNLIQESISALYAHLEVWGDSGILSHQSILYAGTTANSKQPADLRLEQIALSFPVLTHRDEILGLDTIPFPSP